MDRKQQEIETDFTDLDFTKPLQAAAQGMPSSNQATTEHEGAAVAFELASNGCIARRAKSLTPSPPGTKHQLLLIDDNPEFTGVMQKMLSVAGYSVRTASTRGEIDNELREPARLDLIILDGALGELSGFDILVRLRQHLTLSSVPVIMLSALTTLKDVSRALLSGADGYVSKPCKFLILNHAIKTVLDIR